VTIGITVLHETAGASALVHVVFVLLGVIAIVGVFLLQVSQSDAEVAAVRDHALGKGN
jgi:hypothetical protein